MRTPLSLCLRAAALVGLLSLATCGGAPERKPSVLLISIDTLRADALSCYGNPRPTSPVLDGLAAEGAMFANAMAHASSTAPSHASMFTGVTPWGHRVTNVAKGGKGLFKLLDGFDTLAEAFAARGYATAAFTDGGPFSENWQLGQGFEVHENEYEGVTAKVDGLLAQLDATADDERPRFWFLHTYQVHQPTLPPLEFRDRFLTDPAYDGVVRQKEEALRAAIDRRKGNIQGLIKAKDLVEDHKDFTAADVAYLWDLYVASLAFTDQELGRLFDELAARGLDEDLWIVVTSDHGEEFGEHGKYGHSQLHRETLHVPLILRPPTGDEVSWRGRVVEEAVGLVDMHATMMELADVAPRQSIGTSLLAGLESGGFGLMPVHAESAGGFNMPSRDEGSFHRLDRAVLLGDRRLLMVQKKDWDGHGLFDESVVPRPGVEAPGPLLERRITPDGVSEYLGDEGEREDLMELTELVLDHLERSEVLFREAAEGEEGYEDFDEATSAEMRALGYLDGE